MWFLQDQAPGSADGGGSDDGDAVQPLAAGDGRGARRPEVAQGRVLQIHVHEAERSGKGAHDHVQVCM